MPGNRAWFWAQWTWKHSPKAIGVDAAEHDRGLIDEQKRNTWGLIPYRDIAAAHVLDVKTKHTQRMKVVV